MPSTTRPASPCALSSSLRRRRVLWLCVLAFAFASFAACVCCRLLPLHCALSFFASLISALACFFSALLLLLPYPCCPFSGLFLHHVIAFRCPCSSFLLAALAPVFLVLDCHTLLCRITAVFVPYARPAMKPFPKYKSCGVWRCVGDGICASSTVRGVREPAARPWQVVASERIGSDLP